MAKSISELTTQATANETDLFEVAIADQNSASGYASKKESAETIAQGIVGAYTYPLLMPNMQAKTITGAINQLLANVAAAYDSTQTYAVGAFVTYNGQLYKCNTTVDTAETFDPTKWDAVNLADNLGSGGGMHNYSTTEQVVGKWIDGSNIYQKTWDFGSNVLIHPDVWTDTTIVIADFNINAIINAEARNEEGTAWKLLGAACNDSTYIRISHNRSGADLTIRYLTLNYTKTTD